MMMSENEKPPKFNSPYTKYLHWLKIRKFFFVFSLQTGIKCLSLSSFIMGIIITLVLASKLIENQPGTKNELTIEFLLSPTHVARRAYVFYGHQKLRVTGGKEPFQYKNIDEEIYKKFSLIGLWEGVAIKSIILQQMCVCFTSALLIWFCEWPQLVLCWLGSRLTVAVMELSYLPQWGSQSHLHPACFITALIVMNLYGVLVCVGYFEELLTNKGSHVFVQTHTDDPGIPLT